MLYYLIMGSVFLSVLHLIMAIGSPLIFKKKPKSSINQLSYYTQSVDKQGKKDTSSFAHRMILPVLSGLGRFIKRIGPRGIIESNRKRLFMAGIYVFYGVDVFLAIKFLLPIGFLFLLIILAIFTDIGLVFRFFLLAVALLSFFIPDLIVVSRVRNRQLLIRKTLPGALDLLSISVEAGMGFDIALSKVAGNIKGPLGEEFMRMLQDMQLGFSRKEAFQNLNSRTDVPELSSFIVAMTQADVFGISISKVLKVQASEMRTKRRQRAEEEGVKAPVKLVFPLILCLFPALMTVILGPAIIRAYNVLIGIIGNGGP